jgi:plasmid stabilization system protein ParE
VSLVGFEYADSARREMLQILRALADRFGFEAAVRYRALFQQALTNLVDNPERPGVN